MLRRWLRRSKQRWTDGGLTPRLGPGVHGTTGPVAGQEPAVHQLDHCQRQCHATVQAQPGRAGGQHLTHACASAQGQRDTQEDRFCCQPGLLQLPGDGPCHQPGLGLELHFFAVYDGHGGASVSQHCSERLHRHLLDNLLLLSSHQVHSSMAAGRMPQEGSSSQASCTHSATPACNSATELVAGSRGLSSTQPAGPQLASTGISGAAAVCSCKPGTSSQGKAASMLLAATARPTSWHAGDSGGAACQQLTASNPLSARPDARDTGSGFEDLPIARKFTHSLSDVSGDMAAGACAAELERTGSSALSSAAAHCGASSSTGKDMPAVHELLLGSVPTPDSVSLPASLVSLPAAAAAVAASTTPSAYSSLQLQLQPILEVPAGGAAAAAGPGALLADIVQRQQQLKVQLALSTCAPSPTHSSQLLLAAHDGAAAPDEVAGGAHDAQFVNAGPSPASPAYMGAAAACRPLLACIDQALVRAFTQTDAELPADVASGQGSTAVVAVVGESHVWVANCGDSRAVLCREGGTALLLSSDHKASRKDEVARVQAAGGFVWWRRVMGELAISRAIGDHHLRPWVIAQPQVTCVRRSPADQLLLLASDGLWDVMGSAEAAHLALATYTSCQAAGHSRAVCAHQASQALVNAALARGTKDNVTVLVVDLAQPTSPAVAPAPQAWPSSLQQRSEGSTAGGLTAATAAQLAASAGPGSVSPPVEVCQPVFSYDAAYCTQPALVAGRRLAGPLSDPVGHAVQAAKWVAAPDMATPPDLPVPSTCPTLAAAGSGGSHPGCWRHGPALAATGAPHLVAHLVSWGAQQQQGVQMRKPGLSMFPQAPPPDWADWPGLLDSSGEGEGPQAQLSFSEGHQSQLSSFQ